MIKLWLDDLRDPKVFTGQDGWLWVKDVPTAKVVLRWLDVTELSLDHDLGLAETGYDLVKWMAENQVWSKNKPVIHSANPVGRSNMQSCIDRYFDVCNECQGTEQAGLTIVLFVTLNSEFQNLTLTKLY